MAKNGMKNGVCDCGCENCSCSDWGWSSQGRHRLLRLLIGIIIVLGAFFVGMKFGELRELIGGDGWGMHYGYGYMMDGYPGSYPVNGYNGYYGMPMMRYYLAPTSTSSK